MRDPEPTDRPSSALQAPGVRCESYHRARYYDTTTGRFIKEDPTRFDRGDVNFYEYVRNNPAIAVDPWGYSFLVFDRATGTLSAFDKNNDWVFSCDAGNNVPVNYSRGIGPMGRTNIFTTTSIPLTKIARSGSMVFTFSTYLAAIQEWESTPDVRIEVDRSIRLMDA